MGAELSSTVGIVALAAAAVAAVAVVAVAVLYRQLRRLRADQRVVLGEQSATDLISHASALSAEFRTLHDYVTDVAERLDARVEVVEGRLDGSISHWGLIRYDAMNEMSGRQSTTVALLDSSRSGVVLSSIHHRDQARLYAKQVSAGKGELKLSPEEEEALRIAMKS
jgi:hypothetical protein